jgi:CDGSH-type Zn-finger protein
MATEITDMTEPVIAAYDPKAVDVEAGKTYHWCACGKSQNQPFCDGSHAGSDFAPVAYTAAKTCTVYFCMCKHSGRKPLCDGSHSKIL